MRYSITGELKTGIEENEIRKKDGTTFVSYEFTLKVLEKDKERFYRFKVMEFVLGKIGRICKGMMVEVDFNISCREYNGRWFTNLYAWNVTQDSDFNMDEEAKRVEEEDKDNDLFKTNNDIEDDLPF
ncbi:MAG TPA: DUF3127 domain-containing protein [Halanaerobiales bacterium]|nr:DUF3127 domain-containing protein [Halanaerobiales bacterium]